MVGTVNAITAARTDYPSGAFSLSGKVPLPVPPTFEALRLTPNFTVTSIGQADWEELTLGRPDSPASSGQPTSDAFVSFNEQDLERVQVLNAAIGRTSATGREALRLCADKAALYTTLATAGLAMPWFSIASSPDELRIALASRPAIKGLILKPARGTGSVGVYKTKSTDDPDRVAALMAARFTSTDGTASRVVVMEEVTSAIASSEWTVDGALVHNKVVFSRVFEKTLQRVTPPLRDLRMVTPPLQGFGSAREAAARDVATRALEALNAGSSVFHVELRLGSDGAFCPIDIGLRPGGGFICEAIRMASGVDLRVVHALLQVGEAAAADQYLMSASQSSARAAAIGACYWDRKRVFNDTSLQIVAKALEAEKSRGDLLFHLQSELCTSDVIPSDAGMSLCVGAETASEALGRLDRVAHELNFQ